ncbi:shikimate dehydrogenase [Marivirga sp. S37H4]|uniref:Shikimate dehydrogenase n=1 Tax=Marivirga aurantiaca TaxID=2802615 RepID=A0A934WZK9_9BACT|nr:shikimate dehydrogenase [Marivirga aurantiaca]MBK6265806.1 shikimate dehydrogenase [Marivirga aurantiaca]
MKALGLIGYPLKHSFSKSYFTEKFRKESIKGFSYELFPLENIASFPELCKAQNPMGLNVTIPYKEKIIPYLDELDSYARKIGAVNVIKFQNGKTIGYNTDCHGFKVSLQKLLPQAIKSNALILGTGGASKAVKFALDEMKIPSKFVSRHAEKGLTYEEIRKVPEILRENRIIINTTPLGTFPEIENKPDIPYEYLSTNHFLHDLVYNPEETSFMKAGKMQGAKVKNGYEMLVEQAEKAWEIWNS